MLTRTRRAVIATGAALALFATPLAAFADPAGEATPTTEASPEATAPTPAAEATASANQATPAPAPGAGTDRGASDIVTLDLYNLTDVHGHIEMQKDRKSRKVVEAGLPAMNCYLKRATATNPNSSFTLLGDNIGASPYTSGALKDNPTIEALNTMHPLGSTMGNHELDMGQAVFKQRVDGSNPSEFVQTNFPYLAANVEGMGTWGAGTPYLGEYKLWTSPSGVTVAFIGAIAEDVPYKLSPGTTQGLTFKDPIAKINTLAKQLKQDGTAQIVIAMLDDDVKNNYPKMGPDVDGLMGGDTHVPYEFDHVDSAVELTSQNPLLAGVASGSYTDNLGLIQISYDTATGKVVKADTKLIPAATVYECGEDPQTKAVVTRAQQASAVAGAQVVARGYTESFHRGIFEAPDGSIEKGGNRGIESTLGNLAADAMRETIRTPDGNPVDIGMINAGGLRADLEPGSDGSITYKQSYDVMPFSNELGYVTIKGSDVKDALEEQWKTNLNSQNSRPLLKLGLSKNVQYTYDPSKPYGERITSLLVNGAPIDMNKEYTVGSVTFLLAGGDTFPALTRGTKTVLGNLDRDKFNEYLAAHNGIKAATLKQAIGVTLPSDPVTPDQEFTVPLRGLSFSEGPGKTQNVKVSFGSVAVNASVNNSLREEHASDEASIITTDGAGQATLKASLPMSVCAAKPEGGVLSLPVTVETDFGTVVPEASGLTVQVTCPVAAQQPGAAATNAKGVAGKKLARTGSEAALVALAALGMGGLGLVMRRKFA